MILLTESVGGLTLTVEQEYDGAGLLWRLHCPTARAWPLPSCNRQSSGRFYMDSHGERIHGAAVEEVIQTARRSALEFLAGA